MIVEEVKPHFTIHIAFKIKGTFNKLRKLVRTPQSMVCIPCSNIQNENRKWLKLDDMEKVLTTKPGLIGREPMEFVEMFEKGNVNCDDEN